MTSPYPDVPGELITEAVGWLQELLRVDTVNPPGNEQQLVEYVVPLLAAEGIQTKTIEREAGRTNLIAGRLAAGNDAGKLLLSSHADTVPVVQEKSWQVGAFSGSEVDGAIWGRGALDMKFKIAFDIALMIWAARNGCSDRVSQVLVAAEETGGYQGSQFLCEQFGGALKDVHVVNEVGGFPLYVAGSQLLLLQSGEKGHVSFRIDLKGGGMHASTPVASLRMDTFLAGFLALGEQLESFQLCSSSQAFLDALLNAAPDNLRPAVGCLSDPEQVAAALTMLASFDPMVAAQLRGMLYTICTPTLCSIGDAINIASATGSIHFDARLVPGQSLEQFKERVEHTATGIAEAAGIPIEIEFLGSVEGYEIDLDDTLFLHCAEALSSQWGGQFGGMSVAPFLLPAASDSSHYRAAGAIPLGFSPLLFESDFPGFGLAHAVDERVPRKAFEEGLRLYIKSLGAFLL